MTSTEYGRLLAAQADALTAEQVEAAARVFASVEPEQAAA
jgi:hypothetical protein